MLTPLLLSKTNQTTGMAIARGRELGAISRMRVPCCLNSEQIRTGSHSVARLSARRRALVARQKPNYVAMFSMSDIPVQPAKRWGPTTCTMHRRLGQTFDEQRAIV